jgi:succinate-acetate transporter protein
MGFYLLLWGIFTLFMFFGTFAHNTITKIVFGSLTLLFFLLAAEKFTESEAIGLAAGYVGILCGASAIYSSLGQIVNGELKKKIFPL